MTKQLSEEQVTIFKKYIKLFNFSSKIQEQSLDLYLQYRVLETKSISKEKIQIIFLSCFFIAQRSEVMFDGKQIRNISISLTHALKILNLDQFIFTLKSIIKSVMIKDPGVESDINTFIKKFSFSLTFNNKLISTFQKFKAETTNKDYINQLQTLLWMIFIDSKQKLFKDSFEIIDITCLLVCCFQTLLVCSRSYIKYSLFNEIEKNCESIEQYEIACKRVLFQHFKILDTNIIKDIEMMFSQYIQKVLMKQLKCKYDDIFNPSLISSNISRIEILYGKYVAPNDIDERYFLKQTKKMTPSRFTPFGGRNITNKYTKPNAKISHRALNFQLDQTIPIKNNHTKFSEPTIIQLPKFKSNIVKIPLFSTPMTQAMQMYNWVSQKFQRQQNISKDMLSLIDDLIFQQQTQQRVLDMRKSLICNLLSSVMKKNSNINEDISLLVWSIQSVYYILNIKGKSILQTMNMIHIQWYDLWRVADYFLKCDKHMPTLLQMHLLDLQTQLISFDLWRFQPSIISIFNSKVSNCQYPESQRFTKRIIYQFAYQIDFLSSHLDLKQNIVEKIFAATQYIVSQNSALFQYHHLDQILLCTIFSICKIYNIPLKFNELINIYKQVIPYQKNLLQQIVEEVNIYGQKQNIITFYNTIYIAPMKQYLLNLKSNIQNKNNSNTKTISISQIIPAQLKQIRSNSLTPQTHLLYAYNQSPLLKGNRLSNVKPTINNKKILNFDIEIQQVIKKPESTIKKAKSPGPSSTQNISDFINKKFNKVTSPRHKHPFPQKKLYRVGSKQKR